ncbi:MAG: leucine-rich repeat domain-containing protein [Firmicutes bacterium]|uniref:Leucine-rich repeat domain-containing protein n=1 Tax=Candidatus Alloenteromonas pullistercoris TaxID=2840785 RepID=A0A9D9DGW9_9FIRM|nr:leucine-rich repeat domain-containing protein [Candidatus Enteromonas pullistercoris]
MGKTKIALLAAVLLLPLAGCDGGGGSQVSSSAPDSSKDGGSSSSSLPSGEHIHEYGEWEVVEEATCLEEGLKERVCPCGDKQEEAIPALGHEMALFKGTPATCLADGKRDYYQCGRCELYFLDEEGKEQIEGPEDERLFIAKGAHAIENPTIDYYTHGGACSTCGEEISGHHVFNTGNTCSECGYSIEATAIEDIEGIDFTVYAEGTAYANIDLSLFQEEELILPYHCYMGKYEGWVKKAIFTNADKAKTKRIVFPDGMQTFDGTAGMVSLEEVSFGGNVVNIGGALCDTFEGCPNLKSIDLRYADKLKYIGESAFKDTALTSIEIPASVTTIGEDAFYGCEKLANVAFKGNGIKKLSDRCFAYCTSLKEITLPEGLTSASPFSGDYSPFYGCSALESISFPSSFDCSVEHDNLLSGLKDLKHLYIDSPTVDLELVHDWFYDSFNAYKDDYFVSSPLTIHIGKNVKTMENYFLDENYVLDYEEGAELEEVSGLAQYWNKISLFQNPNQESYEIHFPDKAKLVKAEAVKIGFPPKYQDPFIPEINIYIPSGVETLESQAIYLDIVQDEVMDQNVYVNIYLEESEAPASWPSDWYYVNKGTDHEFTYDKTLIRVYTGQAM